MTPALNEIVDRVEKRLLAGLRDALSGRGVKLYAELLGLRHETLLHKLKDDNPDDALRLRQLLTLLVLVEDRGLVMRPLCAELNGQWLPIPNTEQVGRDLNRLFTEAGRELGEVADKLLQGTDESGPGGSAFTDAELDALDREAEDVIAKLRAIIAAARSNRVGGPNETRN